MATTKLGTWIYERGSPSGTTGGGAGEEPPPVIGLDSSVEEKEDGQIEVAIHWTKNPSATAENFTGVKVYLEDPDVSEKATAPLDDTVTFGQRGTTGTPTSVVSGTWQPIPKTESTKSPAVLLIPGKAVWRPIRVYLLSYHRSKVAKFVRANLANPTPNLRIGISAARNILVSGMENTWLIEHPQAIPVTDFDNSAYGPIYRLDFDFDATYEGHPYDSLPLPPGLKKFAGVQITYERPNGDRSQGPYLDINKPEEWHSSFVAIAATERYKCWFVSKDIEGNLNTIKDVTPSVDVEVIYPPTGQGPTPDVKSFLLANKRHATMIDGTLYALADASWTPPDSTRYKGVTIYRVGVDPPVLMGSFPYPAKAATIQINTLPNTSETWTFAAIAYNYDGTLSADPSKYPWTGLPEATRVPIQTWVVGPPGPGGSGQEFTPLGTAGTVTTEQQLNSDGIVMMRHKIVGWGNPTENTFGGMSIARVHGGDIANATWWDAPKNATSYTTEWEPAPAARTWDFYFVSRSMDGKRNSIQGNTPKYTHPFTPMAGDVIVTRLPKDWFDETEFEWPADGKFQAERFVAKKIYVGSILRVGGGTQTGITKPDFGGFENGQIAVYNSSNVLRGWIGEQRSQTTPDQPTNPHTVHGAWFSELYIGGGSPVNAPIYATNSGVVIVGGFEFVQGQPYAPYISIRRNTGIEVGRIGARISRNTDGSTLVPNNDPADIAGAWFTEFAVGGQSLADWRILSRRDASNPSTGADLVNIRNINKFTIDYLQNYPNGSYPNNEPVHLEFGYDAFMVDSTTPGAWKFPGLKINRTNTTHGSMLFTRGLVLYGPNSLRKASLVSWNGEQTGNPDTATKWWGELALYNGAGDGLVLLSAGVSDGTAGVPGNAYNASFFRLLDEQRNINFSVDQRGNVFCRGGLTVTGNLSVTGSFTPSSISTGAITCTSLAAGAGAITGGSLNVGAGNVACGGVTSSGAMSATSFNGPLNGNVNGNVTGNLTGNVSGAATLSATGGITGDHFSTTSYNVINSNGQFIGKGVDVQGEGVNCGGVNIYRYPYQWYGVGYDSFPLQDGRTVHVRGGVIVKIGDATPP
jgi:hypothetical protein